MNFIEYLFIFVSFCLIFVVFDLVKDYTKAKLMKNTVKDTVRETIDVALGTAFRSLLNYKDIRANHKLYQDFKRKMFNEDEGEVDDDEMPTM